MSDTQQSSPTNLRGLLALNGALLALLAAVTFGGSSQAQNRARGDYTMVGGGVQGSDSSAVYIVDATNQEMIALTYSNQTRKLEGIGYRNLAQDANSLMRARPSN